MFNKYYIASKFRFTLFITLMTIIITMSLSMLFGNTYVSGSSNKAYYAITVESGDTLWTIAEKYSDDKTDIRQFIYDISKINDLESSKILVGQKLLIPA